MVPARMIPADHHRRSCRILLLAALALLLLPQGAPAHPPSDMVLAFDPVTRVLSVTITHIVADPTTHYVRRVLITAGNFTVSDNAYTSQPSPQTFTYTYLLPANVSGGIQVRAECSIFGSTTRSLQLTGEIPTETTAGPGGTPTSSATTPKKAGPGFLPVVAAIAFATWRLRR